MDSAKAKLLDHQYGKSRVRVMKVLRGGEGAAHRIKELTVNVSLNGDFERNYTAGDNANIVLTDTMKNTVNALAAEHLGEETEPFAVLLARHFVTMYPQVKTAFIDLAERLWEPLTIQGKPHPHSFDGSGGARPTVRAAATAGGGDSPLESGIEDLLILKSAGSGFENYPKDKYTTLPETGDRILATSLTASWMWQSEPTTGYPAANRAILAAMLEPFAQNYSPSVQTTLFQMGEAVLAACPQISLVRLAMPNKHYLPINLAPFGLPNRNEVFLPTDEPHGQIEATIGR